MFVELHRSRFRFYAKHYPRWFQLAARGIVCLGSAYAAAAESLDALRTGDRRSAGGARGAAHRQVVRLALWNAR
jgi:hypothetical protein